MHSYIEINNMLEGLSNFSAQQLSLISLGILVCIGNYTVREVLMKNRTRVWRNVYNTASA